MRIPKRLPLFGRIHPDQVLDQLIQGRPQKAIAYELGTTHQSLSRALRIERHRRGARSMHEMIALYMERKAREK